MDEEDIRQVMNPLGMDPEVLEVYNCQPIRLRIVRDVLKIRTPYGPWALKRVHMSSEKLYTIYQLTEHVARLHKFSVPRFIRTRYGDPFVIHPTGSYYMTPWLPGREAELRKPEHLVASAGLMAAWHDAAAGFHGFNESLSSAFQVLTRLEMGESMMRVLLQKVRQLDRPSPFMRLVIASKDELVERIRLAKIRLREVGFTEAEHEIKNLGLLCHRRFLKKNILFDGETYTIANYDYAEIGLPIVEFAYFLHRYMPAYDWDEQLLAEVVNGYHEEHELGMSDLGRLSAVLLAPFRPLQIISWYQSREVAWQEEDYIDAYELALDMEEARAHAVEALYNIFCTPHPSKHVEDGRLGVEFASASNVDVDSEQTSNIKINRPQKQKRGKRKTLPPTGPTILHSFESSFQRLNSPSWSSDEHGDKNDEQEHQDK